MPRSPDVTVAAVTQTADRFLIVEERINRRLVFNQPAGHVEKGESLLEAVAREVREETAWTFHPQALLGIYLWRRPVSGRSTLRFAFTGHVTHHDAHQPLDRGIVRTHWLTREEVSARQTQLRSPLVMRCIEDYLAGVAYGLEQIAEVRLETAASLEPLTRL
ncbi:MAG: NUDIX hydrolase [Gammaproteobacteria bacterium]|nr:NUDIX hydrolase [Gammaproteobacteria bacterium]